MNTASDERGLIEAPKAPVPGGPQAPRMRTLLICDLADSTALVERLGDGPAAELLRRHDRVARDLMQRFRGREIDKTDGFLLLFDRPVEAVGFALAYQRALHSLGRDAKQPLRARVGIHVGEVVLWENSGAEIAAGAKPVEVEGLAKPVVARLMALALPGQIVLSGVAFTIAQRAEKELEAIAPLRWLTHGRYHFKGVPAPMLVHEVGESGFAPLQAPPSNAKGVRDVPLWRKPGVLALEVIAVIAAIAIPLALSLRAPPAIAFGERDWIVMGELRNLTGETLLDDSLATAFRISLEQSRHVNVLPDLKLRDALARMQRPPDTTIDRAVASEIALREGARAVIMPTVAEVGGRVRVSAEVVDPNTQTTVYAESADGIGAVSTLDSIDRVTHELRAKLGEALAAIEKDSAPLPRVTSANLDALRAYSLAYRAYMETDYPRALALYRQALSLDPAFAQAKIGVARVHLAGSNPALARKALTEALVQRDRLPPRELLYAEALQAVLEYRDDYRERWSGLISLYPDFFPAYYNFALFTWDVENSYYEPITVASRAVNQKNPALGVLHYLLGTLELGRENVAAALEHLSQARALGGDVSRLIWVAAHATARDFAAADEAIKDIHASGLATKDAMRYLTIAAYATDRAGPGNGLTALAAGFEEAKASGELQLRVLQGTKLTLLELTDQPGQTEDLRRFVEKELERARNGDLSERPHAAFALAMASSIASRAGQEAVATRTLEAASNALKGLYYPIGNEMIAVAQAQKAISNGDFERARAVLRESATEEVLIATRVAEIEVLKGLRDLQGALAKAAELSAMRGRSYVEYGSFFMAQPRNVAAVKLSLLDVAELDLALGDRRAAQRALAKFNGDWPVASSSRALRARVERIQRALSD